MQALAAKSKGENKLALELFQNIKEYEEAAKILIQGKQTSDLINLIRSLEAYEMNVPAF